MVSYPAAGTIRNSVNFPQTVLERKPGHVGARLCIVNKNEPGKKVAGMQGSIGGGLAKGPKLQGHAGSFG